MSAPSRPAFTGPRNGVSFSTNIASQTLAGEFSPHEGVSKVLVNNSLVQDGVNGTVDLVAGTFSYPVTLSPGSNIFNVKVENSVGEQSGIDTIEIQLANASDMTLTIGPVTGIDKRTKRDSVQIIWQQNIDPFIEGYNVYYSLTPGGGLNGYTKANTALITEAAFFENSSEEIARTEETTQFKISEQLIPLITTNAATTSDLSPEQVVAPADVIKATLFWVLEGTTNLTNCTSVRLRGAKGTIKILKDYGHPNFNSADVTDFYTLEGPGLYSIQLTELIGCSPSDAYATLTSAKLEVESQNTEHTLTVIDRITPINFFTFLHTTLVDGTPISQLPDGTIIYYVITAVGFNNTLQQEVESVNSAELVATPLILNTDVQNLPTRAFDNIVLSYINRIFTFERGPDQPDLKPGTVWRDIAIDPPAKESELEYRVIDFVSRSQSFLTLLQLDDANSDGVSDDPATSVFKQNLKEALGGTLTDADVQTQIDQAFENLAANVFVFRKPATAAEGTVVFFKNSLPTDDLTVLAGTVLTSIQDVASGVLSQKFTLLSDVTLLASSASSFYVPERNRFEVSGQISAQVAGASGNIPAGFISTSLNTSGFSGFDGVENLEATVFGADAETNTSLAERAMLAFVSVDVGTENGYKSTALRQLNVRKAAVVGAGDPFMERDWFCPTLEHIGGKVDVYVQGDVLQQVNESFAFTFLEVKNERVFPFNTNGMIIRVVNSGPSLTEPVFKIIEVRNLTRGAQLYDLANSKVIDGIYLDLDETCPINIAIGMGPFDELEISYFYRGSQPYIFLQQPVRAITRVLGEFSGVLEAGVHFSLFKLEDPLQLGNSTKASDFMQIQFANGKPLGQFKTITDERHTLISDSTVPLLNLGAVIQSIAVSSIDGSITYKPDVDYLITPGDDRTRTLIARVIGGPIFDGQEVSVSYEAGELFTVSYTTNKLLGVVQEQIDGNPVLEIPGKRHVTADVVVKDVQKTQVDIEATVVLKRGVTKESVDSRLRTMMTRFVDQKGVGESLYRSDIIGLLESVPGVDYVVLPMTKMAKADGSFSVFEKVVGSNFTWLPFKKFGVGSYISGKFGNNTATFNERHLLEGIERDPLGRTKVIGGSIVVKQIPIAGQADKVYVRDVDYQVSFGASIGDGQTVVVSYIAVNGENINEAHTLIGTVPVALNNPNVSMPSVFVRDQTLTTVFTRDMDFELKNVGGITYISRIEDIAFINRTASAIADGQTVLFSYVAGGDIANNQTVLISYVAFNGTNTDESHILVGLTPVALNNGSVIPGSVVVKNLAKTKTYIRNQDYILQTVGTTTYISRLNIVQYTDEAQILNGSTPVKLNHNGVNVDTILVQNMSHSVVYTPRLDYDITVDGNFTYIARATSDIADGEQVLVDYNASRFGETGNQIVDEAHNLIGTNPVYLENFGVIETSIKVTNLDHSLTYKNGTDYNIQTELDSSVKINRLVNSTILSGQKILVSYTSYDVIPVPALRYKTLAGGGLENQFKGFFIDEVKATLVEDPNLVGYQPSRAYINADGSLILSKTDGSFDHTYHFTYMVFGETGDKDIIAAPLEAVQLGSVTIVYGEPDFTP